MTQELLERTVRDWVRTNPHRGARDLSRLASAAVVSSARSVDEIADALIRLAGRTELAKTRAW
jgi:hypothetical protein